MKNQIKYLVTIALLLSVNYLATAQDAGNVDIISKTDGSEIECVVTEMNSTEVKYHYPEKAGVTLAIENELVASVQFATGEIVNPKDSEAEITQQAYATQKKMALKVGFLSPLRGHTDIGFEYSFKPLQSLEMEMNLIGLGMQDDFYGTARGIGFSAGYKLYASPDFHLRKLRNAHRMSGLYLKPTLVGSFHTQETSFPEWNDNILGFEDKIYSWNVSKVGLVLEVGKQRTFGDIITLDYNVGLGYGTSSRSINSSTFSDETSQWMWLTDRPHGVFIADNNIALTANFKLGILLK